MASQISESRAEVMLLAVCCLFAGRGDRGLAGTRMTRAEIERCRKDIQKPTDGD